MLRLFGFAVERQEAGESTDGGNTMNARKVVVGHDGSASSEAALSDLRRAGLPENVECVVLTVTQAWVTREEERAILDESARAIEVTGHGAWHDVMIKPAELVEKHPAEAGTPADSVAEPQSHGAQALQEAHDRAEAAAARIAAWFPHWSIRAEARPDAPAWGLLDKVREWNADLVVVGTHERSAMGRLIHGSVCQSLLIDAPCSVRIARAPWTSRPLSLGARTARSKSFDRGGTSSSDR
jgi:nucleotide-binding universal stress UspA family protein